MITFSRGIDGKGSYLRTDISYQGIDDKINFDSKTAIDREIIAR